MKHLKEQIIEAVQDATDTVDGTVSIPILDHFLDGMLAEHQNTEELQHPKYFGEWILKNCTFWGNEWFMYKGYRYTGQELFEVWNSPKNVQIDKTNPTQE